MSIQAIAEAIKSNMGSGVDLGASVKFDCGEAGVIVIDGSELSTENKDTDCTIKCDLDVLQSLVDGDLDPTAAFMQGKIKVEGDMGVAMKLQQIL